MLEFDPATLNDPVALQTDWNPKGKVGSLLIPSHKLVVVNETQLKFQITLVTILISFDFPLSRDNHIMLFKNKRTRPVFF